MSTSLPRTDAPRPRPRRARKGPIAAVLALLALAGGGAFLARRASPPAGPRFLQGSIVRGDVAETVRATGTVQPVLQVQVGAQVSGRVTSVAVEINDRVHRGDLLAEIDATPYRAQLAQARAQAMSARAQLVQSRANATLAERNLARAESLRTQGLNAQADVDSALATRDAARAAVGVSNAQIAQAQASVEVAQNNLTYTRVLAPIDGVVATRGVDPGQTVAASFQTPTLFLIDHDLAQMQVIANVDEANIGKLHEGMEATARVDAFPREVFRGTVRTLRVTPITTNGVVTYQAVVDVDNPQLRLRPGMTATVTVVTARHAAVLRVPNAALRYRPSAADATPSPPTLGPDEGAVYVLRQGHATRVPVTVGLTDGVSTEVSSPALTQGESVIVDEGDGATSGAAPGGRSGMRPPRMF